MALLGRGECLDVTVGVNGNPAVSLKVIGSQRARPRPCSLVGNVDVGCLSGGSPVHSKRLKLSEACATHGYSR